MAWPITRADVESYGGQQLTRAEDGVALDQAVAAAVSVVQPLVDELGAATSAHELGAAMLAWRLYQRRLSPGGYANLGELGAAYVVRRDPDIALLLGLNRGRVG